MRTRYCQNWFHCFPISTFEYFRKVASISGDCRRALDICRRAVEIGEKDCLDGKEIIVTMSHVVQAFDEMICNPKVIAIKGCSKYERLFLQAVVGEVSS